MSARPCKRCGAMIRFVATPAGRRLPLNLDPDPNGNVVMERGMARVLTADAVAGRYATATRWMPHQATCEAAGRGRHRRQ